MVRVWEGFFENIVLFEFFGYSLFITTSYLQGYLGILVAFDDLFVSVFVLCGGVLGKLEFVSHV